MSGDILARIKDELGKEHPKLVLSCREEHQCRMPYALTVFSAAPPAAPVIAASPCPPSR
jgi:hypothetical protein